MQLGFLAPCVLFLATSAHAQTVLFFEDFESGLANWSMNGFWRLQEASEPCTAQRAPFPSGTHCMWYGSPTSWTPCAYDGPDVSPKYLTYNQPIVLPPTNGTLVLSYQNWANVENSWEWDMHGAEVRAFGGTAWTKLPWSFNSNFWRLDTRDLTAWAGQTIELRFSFIPVDTWGNSTIGVFLDDVRITEEPAVTLAFSACAADSTWHQWCPCSNAGGPGRGCASSLSATGAGLAGSGTLRVSADTFSLHMDGMSPAAATLFQVSGFSHETISGIAGDGVSCVTGSFIRLVTRFAPGGVLDFPGGGDAPISVLGGVSPGQTRYYAARYRDAAAYCTSATFNITNTIAVYWRP
ncbi:MAG: hypothetical protein JNL28_01255 [Planctomycetes bacterium]|nr:hypothetical protein [Planctomycetota bacterium]